MKKQNKKIFIFVLEILMVFIATTSVEITYNIHHHVYHVKVGGCTSPP